MLCKCNSGIMVMCAAGVAAGLTVGFMAGRTSVAPAGDAMTVAQPEENMDPAEMMEAWAQANQLGPQHKEIASMAGSWDCTTKFWMGPGEPQESTAKETSKTIFDGRYLHSEFTGEFEGEQFTGYGVMAYNNMTKQYESAWIDSMSTGIAFTTGQKEGNKITFHGEDIDPMSGEKVKYRHVLEMHGPNKHTFTGYRMMGNEEVKTMEIEYTRSGQAGGNYDNSNRGNNNGGR